MNANKVAVIKPIKKKSLVKTIEYRKGKKSFQIKETYFDPVLIFECNEFNEYKYDPLIGLTFDTATFLNGVIASNHYDEDKTTYKLILPKTLSDDDALTIKDAYKKNKSWLVLADWKRTATYYLTGAVSVNRTNVYNIEFWTELLQINTKKLSNKNFKEFTGNGMPVAYYDCLSHDADCDVAAIFTKNISLEVNAVDIPYCYKTIKPKYDLALKIFKEKEKREKKNRVETTKLSYSTLLELWEKGSFELTIYDSVFDINKLNVRIRKMYNRYLYDITYDGNDFEIGLGGGGELFDAKIIDSNGKKYKF